MSKYQKLTFITYDNVEIKIYVHKKNAFIEEEQIVLLYNKSKEHINNILNRIIKEQHFEQYQNNTNQKILFNVKIVEEIDRTLKCNNGSQLITFVKNFLKPSSSYATDAVEIITLLLEAASNL